MLTSDLQVDPTAGVAGATTTDPSYFTTPDTGSVDYSGDPGISPPQVDPTLCEVGGIDANGDTIASCGIGDVNTGSPDCLSGTGPLAPGQSYCVSPAGPSAVTPTSGSPSAWSSIGGVLGAIFGGFAGSTQIGNLGAKKTCPNGQQVLVSQPCPTTSASLFGSSSTSMVLLLVLAVVALVYFKMEK